MKRFYLALLCGAFAVTSWAGNAMPMAQNEQVEQRMTAIAAELRCLVCQNESIAGSRADLAVDLRHQIREQIVAGKSDREIMSYMVDRYGDFVRYRPPLKGSTVLLWFGPALLLVASIVALVRYLRRRSGRLNNAPLSDDDIRRADALLQQNHHTGT